MPLLRRLVYRARSLDPRVVDGGIALALTAWALAEPGALSDSGRAELRRIERDLHDGAQARLVALSMQLGRAEVALGDEPNARRLVQDARTEASRAIADLRDLSRGIAPPLLSDRGLAAAVLALTTQHHAELDVANALERERLPAPIERCAYFVVAEALTNVTEHAAAARVSVALALVEGELSVTVADDGHGGADLAGSGLSGLRTRVESVGGTLRVASASGESTTLERGCLASRHRRGPRAAARGARRDAARA